MPGPLTIRATIMQTPAPDRLEVLPDHLVVVDAEGMIVEVAPAGGRSADVDLGADAVLLPGLIDTHIHAPQWPQLGTGLDLPLEEWLQRYTFPLEASLSDLERATEVWSDLVSSLLSHGTTTAVYYGTVDVEATTLLARTCVELGQRALVGRVAMDHPTETPSWYRDADAAAGVAASRRSVEEIRGLGSSLVRPILTPRFIPACTDDLLEGLGRLAAETGVGVQTHCSESDWEHQHVLRRHGVTDTEALDRFGLIREQTVLAHGTFVSDADLDRIRDRGAGIAHCPWSNVYFSDAVFPARRALGRGVPVGLGTDVAGGSSPAVLAQCGHAVSSSRQLENGVDPTIGPGRRGVDGSRIDIVAAFWMATRGGADLIGEPVGLLEGGRAFDAVAVTVGRPGSALRWWPDLDDDARRFEKVVRLAGPDDMISVWVQGRRVR
jgi:guanine deaminase